MDENQLARKIFEFSYENKSNHELGGGVWIHSTGDPLQGETA